MVEPASLDRARGPEVVSRRDKGLRANGLELAIETPNFGHEPFTTDGRAPIGGHGVWTAGIH